jgi:predicted GNAT superfamily acetyltransferase
MKGKDTLLFVLAVGIAVILVMYMTDKTDFNQLKLDHQKELTDEARKVRDSAGKAIDTVISRGRKSLDSIKGLKKEKIYVPYKEIEYRDRDLIDAIRIIDTTEYRPG